MTTRRIRQSATVGIVLVVLAGTAPRPEAHSRKRFRADLQTTSRLVASPSRRCHDEPGNAPVVGLLEVLGAGDATFLGPVIDEQSHCIREDGTFFDGRFALTNSDGRVIRGRYFGHLEPTFNSTFAPGPGGSWLVKGEICISGGNFDDIDNDCSSGRYEPARGITNLSTGDATIFIDQTIGID